MAGWSCIFEPFQNLFYIFWSLWVLEFVASAEHSYPYAQLQYVHWCKREFSMGSIGTIQRSGIAGFNFTNGLFNEDFGPT